MNTNIGEEEDDEVNGNIYTLKKAKSHIEESRYKSREDSSSCTSCGGLQGSTQGQTEYSSQGVHESIQAISLNSPAQDDKSMRLRNTSFTDEPTKAPGL